MRGIYRETPKIYSGKLVPAHDREFVNPNDAGARRRITSAEEDGNGVAFRRAVA